MIFFIKLCIWGALFYLGHTFLKKEMKLPEPKKGLILGILVVFYTLVYFFWNLTRHQSLNTYAIDVSVYLQALTNWHLYSPIVGKSIMVEHFSPLLYLLIPLIKLMPMAVTLFAVQAVVIAVAAIPFYALARRLGVEEWPALLMAFVYLNIGYTRQMAFGDFHIENFMPLFFFTLFYLFLSGGGWKFWLVLIASLTIKEDVGFYLFPWALMVAIAKPEKRTQASIAAAIAFIGGVFSLMVLLPANHGIYPFFEYWSQYGSGLFGIIGGAVRQPFTTIGALLKPEFISVIISMAFLPFFTVWGVALLVPAWIQLSSNHTAQASLGYYYAAPVIPFLFTALAAGWVKLDRRFLQTAAGRNRILWGIAVFLLVFNLAWIAPFSVSSENARVKQLVRKIPPKGRVLAQANVAPHILKQDRVTVLGKNTFKTLPHFVVFHVKGNIWPFSRENYLRALDQMRMDTRYRIWKEDSGVLIFLRKPGVKPAHKKKKAGSVKKKSTPKKNIKVKRSKSSTQMKKKPGKKKTAGQPAKTKK